MALFHGQRWCVDIFEPCPSQQKPSCYPHGEGEEWGLQYDVTRLCSHSCQTDPNKTQGRSQGSEPFSPRRKANGLRTAWEAHMNFLLASPPPWPSPTMTTSPTGLLLAHCAPATLASLLFLQQVKDICSSGSFHLLFSQLKHFPT